MKRLTAKATAFAHVCEREKEGARDCVCGTKVPLRVYRCVSLGLCKLVYECVCVSE